MREGESEPDGWSGLTRRQRQYLQALCRAFYMSPVSAGVDQAILRVFKRELKRYGVREGTVGRSLTQGKDGIPSQAES